MITAVEMARDCRIDPTKFRKALRRHHAQGDPDLSWHHHNERWIAEMGSDRHKAMQRVLQEISPDCRSSHQNH
jgi:hypothetical protein